MMRSIEVLFSPAEFSALARRDLSRTACVVLDILMTALANGAEAIIPVAEISEALALKQQRPEVLLAGEREGLRIGADQTGGIEFDFGNSPREFLPDKVRGKTIAMTTTNGTRALRACAHADIVLIGSFLNLRAIVHCIRRVLPPHLILVCGGTHDQAALEDTLAAGALRTTLALLRFGTGRGLRRDRPADLSAFAGGFARRHEAFPQRPAIAQPCGIARRRLFQRATRDAQLRRGPAGGRDGEKARVRSALALGGRDHCVLIAVSLSIYRGAGRRPRRNVSFQIKTKPLANSPGFSAIHRFSSAGANQPPPSISSGCNRNGPSA